MFWWLTCRWKLTRSWRCNRAFLQTRPGSLLLFLTAHPWLDTPFCGMCLKWTLNIHREKMEMTDLSFCHIWQPVWLPPSRLPHRTVRQPWSWRRHCNGRRGRCNYEAAIVVVSIYVTNFVGISEVNSEVNNYQRHVSNCFDLWLLSMFWKCFL